MPRRTASASQLLYVAFLVLAVPTARADEPITLKIAGVLPATHYLEVEAGKYWTDKVTAATNGRIRFENYPAQQLGKNPVQLAQTGVIDIADEPVAYAGDKLPLSGVVELPNLFQTACDGTAAYRAVSQPGQPLFERDFKPNHLRPLLSVAVGTYKLLTSRKPVHEPDDLKGLKLRSNGGGMEMSVRQLGGVPISMNALDIYQSFSRGTVDGIFFTLLSLGPYDLQHVARYGVLNFSFGSAVESWMISDLAWSKIAPSDQAIMIAAAKDAETHFCRYDDARENAEAAALQKDGVQMIALDPAAQQAFATAVAPVAQQWASLLDQRHYPATAVLQAFRDAVAKHGDPAAPAQ